MRAILAEAEEALAECRRALEAMRAAAVNDNRGLAAALDLADAALERLEGGS